MKHVRCSSDQPCELVSFYNYLNEVKKKPIKTIESGLQLIEKFTRYFTFLFKMGIYN